MKAGGRERTSEASKMVKLQTFFLSSLLLLGVKKSLKNLFGLFRELRLKTGLTLVVRDCSGHFLLLCAVVRFSFFSWQAPEPLKRASTVRHLSDLYRVELIGDCLVGH